MTLGETIFSAFLQALFQQLMSPGVIGGFLKLFGGENLPKTIKKCKDQLTVMEILLRSAEQKQIDDEVVRPLMADLQDIALDLEDILDELATEAQLYELEKMDQEDDNDHQLSTTNHVSELLGSSTNHMVRNIIGRATESVSTLFNPVASISSRLDGITERLHDLQVLLQFSGLSAIHAMPQQTHQAESSQRIRETSSLLGERVVYGRDNRKGEIIQQLLEEDRQSSENYVVIPIVGMGGIGKTTLAQYVYNDEKQVKGHFDLKAWVCVSDVFDVKRITIAIINSATSQTVDCISLNEAQEKLKQVLTGKKFLIVLDDIWSEKYDDWHQLQAPFRDGEKGSRVIMTTRNQTIARMMIKDQIHGNVVNLEGLSYEDSWHLFQQHANHDPALVEMQDDIIERCKGLPLAVKTLAGLLKSTVDNRQRQEILDSNLWSQKSDLLPALMLSYCHLPPHLKHIFAYMSIFSKDGEFSEKYVVLLWMAQGFLPENKTSRMEDVGHNYFLNLVSRSLFEKVCGEDRFTMHDLIHDLAQWAAGDLYCTIGSLNMPRDLTRTRHLYLTKDSSDGTLGNQLSASQLRTCIFDATIYSNGMNIKPLDYVQRLQYVRSLVLDTRIIEELPECLGGLKHLRLLLILLQRIKVLPKSISRLCNLQTLVVDCDELEEVPHIRFLVKLRHLFIYNINLKEMPLGMGRLISLQTLDGFVLGADGGARIRELRKLNHLHGKLSIFGLENVTRVEDAEEAQLHKKHGLDTLRLIWNNVNHYSGKDVSQQDEKIISGVLEQLKPHTSIKKCTLRCYRGLTLPAWLGDVSFKNMVNINLVYCTRCESLSPLGQLPLLTYLEVEGIEGIKKVGEEFYGAPGCSSVPFQALKHLSFREMKNWEKWVHSPVDNNRAFPCLENLFFEDCESLQGDLPPHMPSLKRLNIRSCEDLSISLPSVPLLEELTVYRCRVLSASEDVIFCPESMDLEGIKQIVGFPGCCRHFHRDLRLRDCHSLSTIDQIPMTVQKVGIESCNELKSVEFEKFTSSSCLEELNVVNCKSLIAITEIPLMLQTLEITYCEKLEVVAFQKLGDSSSPSSGMGSKGEATSDGVASISIQDSVIPLTPSPQALSELAYLVKLSFYNCLSLVSLPPSLLLPALEHLEFINCENMEGLPGEIHNFTSLRNLRIDKCPKIQCFSEGGLPRNLRTLSIEGVNTKQQAAQGWCLPMNLRELTIRNGANIEKPIGEWGLHLLTSLQQLTLGNIHKRGDCNSIIDDTVECIPGPDLYLPSSLETLRVLDDFSNLKTICCSALPNLTKITIWHCPKLGSFGDNGLPPWIRSVSIEGCDLILKRSKEDPHGRIYYKYRRFSLCL